ncbi:replication protein [Paenibacillus rigui]|uniref:Bacteriophage lambda Replication protein O N-terminal domain-containing protein n=1 Tax=Paenibacillus rigui TaxID=554312 RepID=A0A229UV73_9BACL|nr:replication protein [Paenibacillus rigui]OXM87302.1 hypothetical protein CF651_06630 [Paenibacillus rigui]
MFRRDFTKRQRTIIHFISLLSFELDKSSAIIPKLQDFELCGISSTKIKAELVELAEAQVIIWDKDIHEFKMNLNFEEWRVAVNSKWMESRFQDLLLINKRHSEWQ